MITLAIAVIIGISWFTPDHIKAKMNREARAREIEQRQSDSSRV